MNTKNTKLIVSAALALLLGSVPGVSAQDPRLRGIATSTFEEQVNEAAAIVSDSPPNAIEEDDYQDLDVGAWVWGEVVVIK